MNNYSLECSYHFLQVFPLPEAAWLQRRRYYYSVHLNTNITVDADSIKMLNQVNVSGESSNKNVRMLSLF